MNCLIGTEMTCSNKIKNVIPWAVPDIVSHLLSPDEHSCSYEDNTFGPSHPFWDAGNPLVSTDRGGVVSAYVATQSVSCKDMNCYEQVGYWCCKEILNRLLTRNNDCYQPEAENRTLWIFYRLTNEIWLGLRTMRIRWNGINKAKTLRV